MNSSCNGPLLCKLNFCSANGWVRQKDPETKPQPPSWVYLMCKWLLHNWTCTSCNSPTSTWGTPAFSSNDLMGQTWQPCGSHHWLSRSNNLSCGIGFAALQGGWRQPGFAPGARGNSAVFFRQDFIKPFGRFWATNSGVAERSLGGKTWNEDVEMICLIDGYSMLFPQIW